MEQSTIPTKICTMCWGRFTLANFYRRRYTLDGLSTDCSHCRTQTYSAYTKKKFNTVPKNINEPGSDIIRRVQAHHDKILPKLMKSFPTALYAFSTTTPKEIFLVQMSIEDDTFKITFYLKDSVPLRVYREIIMPSDNPDLHKDLCNILAIWKIRLEVSESVLQLTRKVVYFEP